MPISAVVDASVLVSAFLFPEGVPGRVLKLARQGKFVLHHSPLLLDETRLALLSTRLRDTYGHGDAAVLAWCTELEQVGRLFAAPLPEIEPICRDPDDDHVIATALAVNADFIVTGDKDLLALSQYRARVLDRTRRLRRLLDPSARRRWKYPSGINLLLSPGCRPAAARSVRSAVRHFAMKSAASMVRVNVTGRPETSTEDERDFRANRVTRHSSCPFRPSGQKEPSPQIA